MRMRQTLLVVAIMLILLLTTTGVFADDPTAESNAKAIDTIWMLIAAFLVFFMQAGFAMVEYRIFNCSIRFVKESKKKNSF